MRKIRVLKPTVEKRFDSREGLLIGKDEKIIYDDSWLHPEVFDPEWEEETNRRINKIMEEEMRNKKDDDETDF